MEEKQINKVFVSYVARKGIVLFTQGHSRHSATAVAAAAAGTARPHHPGRAPARRHQLDLDVGRRRDLGVLMVAAVVVRLHRNLRLQHDALQLGRLVDVVDVDVVLVVLVDRRDRRGRALPGLGLLGDGGQRGFVIDVDVVVLVVVMRLGAVPRRGRGSLVVQDDRFVGDFVDSFGGR